jgi:hypothetical protein
MTFSNSVWMVDGNQITGVFARLMQQSTWGNNQGVMNIGDMYVSANSTPNSGVNIASGSCVVNGSEVANQGSYFGENVGTDNSLTIASTGSTARSDMIVARAEDWTFSGSPWTKPGNSQVIFPRVISNVGSGVLVPPGGSGSCIPLARIDVPSSTSAITQGMITDLRYMVTPRSQPNNYMLDGVANGGGTVGNGTTGVYQTFPSSAVFSVNIPVWAVAIHVDATWTNLMYSQKGTTGVGNAGISFRVILGTYVSGVCQFATNFAGGDAVGGRHTIKLNVGNSTTFAIPAAMRGTTQNMTAQAAPLSGFNGRMTSDSASMVSLDWKFYEATLTPGT